MSRFYGTVSGAGKTDASRRGHNEIVTHAASWYGAVRTNVWLDAEGRTRFKVEQVPWHGTGDYKVLAEGVMHDPKAEGRS